jgi:hypothetical protein
MTNPCTSRSVAVQDPRVKVTNCVPYGGVTRPSIIQQCGIERNAEWDTNAVLIGGAGFVASVAAWLLCSLSGYTVAAWVAPLAISAFCLGRHSPRLCLHRAAGVHEPR